MKHINYLVLVALGLVGNSAQGMDNASMVEKLYASFVSETTPASQENPQRLNSKNSNFLLNGQLMEAIRSQNIIAAERALQLGANINYKDPQKLTPLYLATRNTDLPMVNMLLTYNPDLNVCCGSYRETALHRAIKQCSLISDRAAEQAAIIIRKLLAQGAKLDIVDGENKTAQEYLNGLRDERKRLFSDLNVTELKPLSPSASKPLLPLKAPYNSGSKKVKLNSRIFLSVGIVTALCCSAVLTMKNSTIGTYIKSKLRTLKEELFTKQLEMHKGAS